MGNYWQKTAVCSALLCSAMTVLAQPAQSENLTALAEEVYVFAYPLVLMDITGRVSTNFSEPDGGTNAPVNQFAHAKAFPDHTFTAVVRPNADTLYSSLVYNVSKEPLIIEVPASKDRYFLLPMLDKWTEVWAVPGTRTNGAEAYSFAIVGPNWQGELPKDVRRYDSPTPEGWIGGRVQANGVADFPAVHAFQAGLKAYPLSAHGKPYTPPKGAVDAKLDMSMPPEQVEKMSAEQFYTSFANLMKTNPPHKDDAPLLAKMEKLGIKSGEALKWQALPEPSKKALSEAMAPALVKIKQTWRDSGEVANGWKTNLKGIGVYGTDYIHRAGVAFGGLGANAPVDAVYPTVFTDSENKQLNAANKYRLHFAKDKLPPVKAFWSLTMYDERQLFTENSLSRFAIGDRDKLTFNQDGSLDLYVQSESPGKALESNWLPAPKSGDFSMNMRLYWPEQSVLDGSWSPPAVERVQ